MVLENITNLAAVRASKGRRDGGAERSDERPLIRVEAGKLDAIVDAAEEALLKADGGLFKQGPRIVRIIWDKIKLAGGADGDILRLSQVTVPHLVECLTAAARWEKWDGRSEDWVVANAPPNVAETYLARNGDWRLPFLLGIVTAPTLRADGSILDKPGYDERTGIVFNPAGIEFPPIAEKPTRAEAMVALDFLRRPLAKFKFARGGRAVALSGILTALIRRALPTAPLHAFSAPTAGAGKSMLVDLAAVIATGERAAVISSGEKPGGDGLELEKRISAAILAGDLILNLDNLEQPLRGQLICQCLTQTIVQIRWLGRSEKIDAASVASFFATGNNLAIDGDLTRRVLTGVLEIDDERPELRHFDFNPVAMVKAARGEYVRAALTVMRAYAVSGDRIEVVPLGSFEEWSRMVRDPLLWLGEDDAASVIEEVRHSDPKLGRFKQVAGAWAAAFGDRPMLVRDVIRAALATEDSGGAIVDPDLRDAIYAIMGGEGRVSAEKISWWLRKNAKRNVNNVRFERDEEEGGAHTRWKLVGAAKNTGDTETIKNNEVDDELPF